MPSVEDVTMTSDAAATEIKVQDAEVPEVQAATDTLSVKVVDEHEQVRPPAFLLGQIGIATRGSLEVHFGFPVSASIGHGDANNFCFEQTAAEKREAGG